jgi:tetratricopeptide (TPR) repeat protein
VALGLWDDVIAANEKAIRVVDQHRAAHGESPKACGHYVSWLHYAFLQERRFDEAKQQLDACRQMAMEILGHDGPLPADDSFVNDYAEMRVFHAIETGRWDAADPFVVPKGPYAGPRLTQAYGEALAAAGGDLTSLHAAAARLRERQKDLLAEIEQKKENNYGDAGRRRAEVLVQQIDALERLREGKKDEGIALLRKAAEAESGMPLEFGPPVVEKPAFELLGDELLALGRHAEAEQAYQSALARAPGRTRSLQGLLRAQQALGKTDAAGQTQAQLQRYVRAEPATR